MKISTSILSTDDKIKAINKLNNTDTDYIHYDIMDGIFVNNKAFSVEEIIDYSNNTKKKIDAHFMVDNPLYYIDRLKDINFDIFTFHVEVNDVDSIINRLKSMSWKIGLSIKPNTNLDILSKYLDDIDLILIMSVEPGYGGQKFIDSTYDRIKSIREMIGDRNILIEVDGGINDTNIKELNVDIAVVGSFITNSNNYQEKINLLK